MDIFKQYAVDPKLEQDGKWFDIGDSRFLIARSYNAKFTRMLTKLYEAHKHILELKDTPEQIAASNERSDKIMAEVMAHSVLLDWENVTDQGKPLPYSVANAQKALEYKEFQKEIAKRSDEYKNFRYETEESDVKNSSPTSSGASPGVEASSISKD